MSLHFYKYHGTGNDFILIDNRHLKFPKNNTKLIAGMCDRNFGIGADGLILLENHPSEHFTMVYFNSDGNESSMCGNGGRCLVHFANYLGIIDTHASFEAIDGIHEATIDGEIVSLKMGAVNQINTSNEYVFLNTGSPHHVELVPNVDDYEVVEKGRSIRNSLYGKEGANVNFVTPVSDNSFKVRTYERGVENETLSCGTGVTAVAIAMYATGNADANSIELHTPGGQLEVSFESHSGTYTNVILKGPAKQVFKGIWI